MEDAHFTETEKSKTNEVKCENDVHCFFDVRGIVHREFIPPGQTVNQEFTSTTAATHMCSKFNYHRKTPQVVRHTLQIATQFLRFPPKQIPTLTWWWVAWSNDPESYDGSNITTGRTSHVRQVKGDDLDKKGYPHPPGWGLCMGLTIPPQKNMFC